MYLLQHAYQIVAEEFKYKKIYDYLLENFPDIGYAKEKFNKKNIFYTKEEFNKLFNNFLGVESICHRCKLTFPSNSLIHKYLKSNCTGQNQENNTALSSVFMLPFVIKSTTSSKTIGSGYAFRS